MSTFPRAWAIGVINKMQDYFEARFENTFKKRIGESDQQYIDRLVNTTCEILEGVTAEQIKVGLATMKTAKYCPVMPEFKNWCLGGNDNAIHASYRKKSAALANIEAWLCDDTTQITNAEREAYNRCYGMFNDLQFNYSAKQKFHTYEAFKDFYDEVVKEFVGKGVYQCIWEKPIELESKVKFKPKPKDYLSELPDDFKEKLDETKNIMAQKISEGMTAQEASRFLINQGFKKND